MIQREYLTRMMRSPFGSETVQGQNRLALDIGCAYGYVVALLHYLGFNAVGLDVSQHALATASMRLKSCDFVRNDVSHGLPFRKLFRLVTCFEVLEHLSSPRTVLQNIYDVLVEGGILFMSTPNRTSPHCMICGPDPHHVTVLGAEEWSNLMREVGFRDIHMQYRDYVPLAWKVTRRFVWFGLPKIGISLFISARK